MAVSKRSIRRTPAPARDPLTDAIEPEEDEEAGEEAAPVSTKSSNNGDDAPIRGGWTAGQQVMDSTSNFAQSLKLEEKSVILKFLEDTPFANFRRHWIERSTKDGRSLRAYTCLQTVNKDCPLCEAGDRAQAVSSFNVAVVGDDGQVLLKSWDCGPRLFNVLKAYANDPKIAPLSKGFFVASKTGKRGTVQHNVSPVSRTALIEDYEIEPPDTEMLAKLKRYTSDIIEIPPLKTLRELAEELADEYE